MILNTAISLYIILLIYQAYYIRYIQVDISDLLRSVILCFEFSENADD